MRKRFRRRDAEPESMDAILARAGEDRFAPRRPPVTPVLWRQAVGPRIADRTVPLSLERGTLLVQTATSAWASELSLLQSDIVDRLRRLGIEVKALRFRASPVAPPQRPLERRTSRAVPRPAELPPRLAHEVERIPDEELRGAVEEAARANLAWQGHIPIESRLDARAPRSAEKESAPPDRSPGAARSRAPGTRAGGRGRSR